MTRRPAGGDGRDDGGRALKPGIYLVRFEGATGRSVVKIAKLRTGPKR